MQSPRNERWVGGEAQGWAGFGFSCWERLYPHMAGVGRGVASGLGETHPHSSSCWCNLPDSQHLAARGPVCSPAATWSCRFPRPCRSRQRGRHRGPGTHRVRAPLSASHPHRRGNNEGNCLWFWLYFTQSVRTDCACESSDAVGGKGPDEWAPRFASEQTFASIFFVNRLWTGPSFQTSV